MIRKLLLMALISLAAVLAATAQDAPVKKQCTATTVKGAQCRNKTTGQYCTVHDPGKQCGAPTQKGTPCKTPVKVKGAKCWRHS